jgi:hypothetical protein
MLSPDPVLLSCLPITGRRPQSWPAALRKDEGFVAGGDGGQPEFPSSDFKSPADIPEPSNMYDLYCATKVI